MAIALVAQDANSSSTPSGSSAPVACTSSTAGNLMVLSIHVQSTTTVVNSVTDNLGSVWVKAVDLSTSGSYTGIWYLANCGSGVTTVTATLSASTSYNANVSQWSGAAASSTVRSTNSAAVLSSPNRTGTVTATAGDLAIGAISSNSATARTLSAPFTALTTGTLPANFTGSHAYDLPGSGSEEAQWTTASGANTGGVIALFIPAVVSWTAEGGTNGVGITAGNSGGASGDAFESVSLGAGASAIYDSTNARGTLAAKLATGGSAADCSLNYQAKIGTQTQVWYRAYVFMASNPGSNHRLFDAWDSVSGQLCFAVYLTTAGKLMSVNTIGGTIQTMTGSVPLSAWFRVEVMVIGSATVGQVEIKRFDSPDSTVATETLTSAASQNTRGSFNNYRFGSSGDPLPASRTLWLDDLGISTTGYMGPTGPAAVTLTPATAAWSAVATTPTPQPVNLTVAPAAAAWSAVAVSAAPGQVQRTLTPAVAAWSARPLTVTPQPVALTLAPAAAVWSAMPVMPVGPITHRPNTGITARPSSGITVRPNTGTTTRP